MKLAILILVTVMVSPVLGLYIDDEMHAYGDIRAPGVLPLPPECKYTPPPANHTFMGVTYEEQAVLPPISETLIAPDGLVLMVSPGTGVTDIIREQIMGILRRFGSN